MAKRLSPQEMMAQRNPLTRSAVSPVDIYNQAPEQKTIEEKTPNKPIVKSKEEEVQPVKKETARQKAVTKKVETADSPYSTYLFKKQVKGIKLRAIEEDVNDKEIVQRAIDEYFKNHPL